MCNVQDVCVALCFTCMHAGRQVVRYMKAMWVERLDRWVDVADVSDISNAHWGVVCCSECSL